MSIKDMKCLNCYFCLEVATRYLDSTQQIHTEFIKECHYYPPSLVQTKEGDIISLFPKVKDNDCCGKWLKKI